MIKINFFKIWVSSLFFIVLSPIQAPASVSLKNGNYFIGYTDLVYPGGFEPKIERIYNSKTPYKGMFGWGWGSEYEAYLNVSADGSVVLHEYGGGAENRFNPTSFNAKELEDAVNKIAEVAQKAGALGSADAMAAYKNHLKTDAIFRNDEWEKFRAQGKLKPRELSHNTQLHSNRFSYQYITKVKGGYIRIYDNGRIEKFNENGKLARVQDKNNNFIEFSYGKDGKISRLADNFNRKIFFFFNSAGFLEKVQGENGKEATYKYNNLSELESSKDVDGNHYTYKYSSDKRHNMIEIGYSDKTSTVISYFGRDKMENVKSVKSREGALTEYTYGNDPANKDYVSVAVEIKGSDGQSLSKNKYEYFFKRKADGEEWTYKTVSLLDGEKTETVYNEGYGLPVYIKRGEEETRFEYDGKGHVIKKTTPSEITELTYDSKVSKVSKVVRHSKTDKKQMYWSTFKYDLKGNLILAKNSDSKTVKLFYDLNGRIRSLVDQGNRRIDFKYNEHSKPIMISDPKLGAITVSYTNSGEIKKVDSSAGRKIALQVTSAFQNLLDIIRPAGVTLSF
jgi:YD repeat-containing protein